MQNPIPDDLTLVCVDEEGKLLGPQFSFLLDPPNNRSDEVALYVQEKSEMDAAAVERFVVRDLILYLFI